LLPSQTPLTGGFFQAACNYFLEKLENYPHRWYALLLFPFIFNLATSQDDSNPFQQSLSWMDEWQFFRIIRETLATLGLEDHQKDEIITALRVMIAEQDWFDSVGQKPLSSIVKHWLADIEVQRILRINRYQNTLWFHKEGLDNFLWWMMAVSIIQVASNPKATSVQVVERMIAAYEISLKLIELAPKSGYQLENLLDMIED
jgi:hypothetical protein